MKYAIASNSGVFSHSFPDKLESYLKGVDPIEMSHRSRKGCVGCLNQEVIVIVHETVPIDPHSPHLAGLAKQIQKTLPILIVKKDLLPGGAPIHDMVVGTRVLNPQGTGHAGNNTLPNP